MTRGLLLALLLPFADRPASAAEPSRPPAAWLKAKQDARGWTNAFLAAARKAGKVREAAAFEESIAEAWDSALSTEKSQRFLHERRSLLVPAEADRSRRLFELNLLYVYGNVFPRIIRETAQPYGGFRAMTDMDASFSIEETAFRKREASLRNGSGFPEDLMPELARPRP